MPNSPHAPLLVLIGFMGAGKSTVGRLLASRLGRPFFDLDNEIVRVHGPIPEIFAAMGESGFRAIEHHQLDRLLPVMPRPGVLALGGGAFLQPANRELLTQHGATVIFLDAPFELISARISHGAQQRPLARDPELLRCLYEQRRPVYQLADYAYPSTPEEPGVLVNSLVRLVERLAACAPKRDTL
ncbi:MAG: shikimate kinase [Acidobacteriota bacterium]|nr:shikimate kinase [Acidobacteriota bacterium]